MRWKDHKLQDWESSTFPKSDFEIPDINWKIYLPGWHEEFKPKAEDSKEGHHDVNSFSARIQTQNTHPSGNKNVHVFQGRNNWPELSENDPDIAGHAGA